jgi:hypothetical protein
VINNEKHQNDSTKSTGHDVQKAQTKGSGLSLPARHWLAFNTNQ